MDLLLIRHAVAEERDSGMWPDDADRPLTDRGRKRFSAVARGLGATAPDVTRLFSSPFVRAWQTAELLHKVAGWPRPEEMPALAASDALARVPTEVGKLPPEGTYALVGHEPDMSELLTVLCYGVPMSRAVKMKKGAAALVRLSGGIPSPGTGTLEWLLDPTTARLIRP